MLKLLVLDFDGVLTDNNVYTASDGTEFVQSSKEDSLGLARLKASEFPILCVSTEMSPYVPFRCKKLGINYLHGVKDKWPVLREYLNQYKIDPIEVIYIGNDYNDFECLQNCGVGAAPIDYQRSIQSVVDCVLRCPGGHG